MTNIELKDKSYSWKEATLADFLEEGNVPEDWCEFFHSDNIRGILTDISTELAKESRVLYPPLKDMFRAFYMTPLHTFKVVLLRQDHITVALTSSMALPWALRSVYGPGTQSILRQ